MTHLVAKRKSKNGINLESDYFIFGVYPNNSSFFIDHLDAKNFDYSESSFNIKQKVQYEKIISHFFNPDSQLEFILFSKNSNGDSQFINKIDDPNMNYYQKDKYMKEIIQIKPKPSDRDQENPSLTIINTKISSFSPKNEALVLSDFQYKAASDLLRFLSEKRFGKITIQINQFSYPDLCFIPVSVSHLYTKNQFDGPFLIIAKYESTVELLFDLFNQWTLFKTLIILGNDIELEMLQNYVFPLHPKSLDIVKYHVVLTSQPAFAKLKQFFSSLMWNLIITIDNQKSNLQTMQSCSHFGINIIGVIEQKVD